MMDCLCIEVSHLVKWAFYIVRYWKKSKCKRQCTHLRAFKRTKMCTYLLALESNTIGSHGVSGRNLVAFVQCSCHTAVLCLARFPVIIIPSLCRVFFFFLAIVCHFLSHINSYSWLLGEQIHRFSLALSLFRFIAGMHWSLLGVIWVTPPK